MKSVHYRGDDRSAAQVIEEARESLMIVAPHLDDQLLGKLFALAEPVDVNLLTRRKSVREGGRRLRDHIKQLQDINGNVEVRVTDEGFPAFTIVDGAHLHCFSRASKRLAAEEPETLVEAAQALWARSDPLESRHLEGDTAVNPS
jgi:hypothetical protein